MNYTKLLLVSLILILPASAWGQEPEPGNPYVFDPVVVTANKSEQSVQDISASVSVITSGQIQDSNISNIEGIFKATPNIFITTTGPKASVATFASIRGIASSMGGSPVLGVYVDDIYYPRLDMTLMDIDRVEVLRGPQGTLYGRNTEAGVINIITKNPTNDFSSKLTAEYESFNTRNFIGTLSGPIVEDVLLFRVAGSYKASDNYFENKLDGDKKVNAYEDKDFRFKLMTAPNDRYNVALTVDIQDYWGGGYADFSPIDSANPRKNIDMDFPGSAIKKAYSAALRAEYAFSDVTLTSVTSFRKDDSVNDNDIDFLPIDIMRLHLGYDTTIYSEELRIASNNKTSPLQWIAGTYGYYEESDYNIGMRANLDNMGMPGMGIMNGRNYADVDSTGLAFFGQVSYTLWDKLELTGGIRYDTIRRKIDYSRDGWANFGLNDLSGNRSETYEAWLPKAAISYKITDNIRPYFSVSRGFREGGFNVVDDIGHPYDSEYTWNYELGMKTEWFDNRLILNAALFHIDWTDRQIEIMDHGGSTFHIDNAGKAVSRGFELEAIARPLHGLELTGSFGYTDVEYKDYKPQPGVDYSGNKAIDTPRYTARLGATYRLDNGLFFGASYNHYGKVYFDPANEGSQGEYQIVDARIGYEHDDFEVYLYARNIFDETYFTRSVHSGVGGSQWYGRQGEPQTFGISLSYKF
jgi:iron complex outermembrane receptor protein